MSLTLNHPMTEGVRRYNTQNGSPLHSSTVQSAPPYVGFAAEVSRLSVDFPGSPPADGLRRFCMGADYACGIVLADEGYQALVLTVSSSGDLQLRRYDAANRMPGRPAASANVDFGARSFEPEPVVWQGLMLFAVGGGVYALDLYNANAASVKQVASVEGHTAISGVLVAAQGGGGSRIYVVMADPQGTPTVQTFAPAVSDRGVVSLAESWTPLGRVCEPSKQTAGHLLGQGAFAGPVFFLPTGDTILAAVPPAAPGKKWHWQTGAFLAPPKQALRYHPLRLGFSLGSPQGGLTLRSGAGASRFVIHAIVGDPDLAETLTCEVQALLDDQQRPIIRLHSCNHANGLDLLAAAGRLYGTRGLADQTWPLEELGQYCIRTDDANVPRLPAAPAGVLRCDALGGASLVLVRETTLKLLFFDRGGVQQASAPLAPGKPLCPPLFFNGRAVCLWTDDHKLHACALGMAIKKDEHAR